MLCSFALVYFLLLFRSTVSSRILVIPCHSNSASHIKSMYPLAANLAKHGHEVVVLHVLKEDPSKVSAPAGSNIKDKYVVIPLTEQEKNEPPPILPAEYIWGKRWFSGPGFIFPWMATTAHCKNTLDDKKLKGEFDSIVNEKWDLLIVDDIFTACGMLASKRLRTSNVSTVNFGTTILMPHSMETRGVPINMALYPSILRQSADFDHRTFLGRLLNVIDFLSFYTVIYGLDYAIPYWLNLPRDESTVPTLFAKHNEILMNSVSFMLEITKPMSNDIIELDIDCPPKAQLPENYRKFVEDPKSKGTVVLAMGHAADWDNTPPAVAAALISAFSRLTDYRIVWQYVTKGEAPKVPSHMLLDTWLPQSGLLYHPKTKLFISHMGGKSLRESICAAVPVLTIPLFAEQYKNAATAINKGLALFLDKTHLSEDIIYQKITTLLTDETYRKNARALRDQLDDRIMKPMELGRFWSEFMIRNGRHRFRKYFHMHTHKQRWFQSGNMDVITAGSVALALITFTILA